MMIKLRLTPQGKEWWLAGDGDVVTRTSKWKVWWYLMRHYHKGRVSIDITLEVK